MASYHHHIMSAGKYERMCGDVYTSLLSHCSSSRLMQAQLTSFKLFHFDAIIKHSFVKVIFIIEFLSRLFFNRFLITHDQESLGKTNSMSIIE
jgi:hypothetical protein